MPLPRIFWKRCGNLFWWSRTSADASYPSLSSPDRRGCRCCRRWNGSSTRVKRAFNEEFKLMDPVGANRGIAPANLVPDLYREIEAMARRAFNVLGLRDYGRFDIRLSPGGTPFFLEANTTPSLEPLGLSRFRPMGRA